MYWINSCGRRIIRFSVVRNSWTLPCKWITRMAVCSQTSEKFQLDIRAVFESAVAAVYPPKMIRNAVAVSDDGNSLTVDGRTYKLNNNVYVVGFGKAVSGMARAVEDLIGQHIVKGVVSVPHGTKELFSSLGKEDMYVSRDSKIIVHEGARNNLPDSDAHKAAMAIQKLVGNLTVNDILIVLISGGGSALLPLPTRPVTLEDELQMTKVVSTAGGSIQDLNTLRQNIEVLKGGGLARIAKPSKVIALILSDVIDDKLDMISSGPTSPLLTSARQCLQILDRLNVKDTVPASVVKTLTAKVSEKKSRSVSAPWQAAQQSDEAEWSHVQNVIIGSNAIATKAAVETAYNLGYIPVILTNSLQGEAKSAATMFTKLSKYVVLAFANSGTKHTNTHLSAAELDVVHYGISKYEIKQIEDAISQAYNSHKAVCIICGGETTVQVKGTGKGGRNQEMALAFAIQINKILESEEMKCAADYHIEFFSAGTDGQDGPTDAAGAIVSKGLVKSATAANLDLQSYLDNNDSYTLFKTLEHGTCLVQTGLTGTNVMDIQLLVIKPIQ